MDASQKAGTHSLHFQKALEEKSKSAAVQKIKKILPPDSKLYLVGGIVRDIICGIESADIDLTTDVSAEDALKVLEKNGVRVIPTGLKHGTITAVIEDQNIEITTFRTSLTANSESKKTIEQDLLARDFTINAMAFDIDSLQLVDPANGFEDCQNKILRAVENPLHRFKEDPLRVLRAIRFGTASGRKIDDATQKAIPLVAPELKKIAVERIRVELEKIVVSPFADDSLRMMKDLSLLEYTFPELIPTIGFEQNRFHTEDVFDHTLSVLKAAPADLILRLSAIYHDIGKAYTLSVDKDGNRHFYDHEKISAQIAKESMQKLKFSNDITDAVVCVVRMHMRPLDCGPSGVRRVIRDAGEHFDRWRQFKNADRPVVFDDDLLEEIKNKFDQMVYDEEQRKIGSVYGKLEVNGDDLMELGMKPGKKLGAILNRLKEFILDEPQNNQKEILISKAKEFINSDKD